MGTYVFKLPDVGEGIAEAEIVAWHVKVGDVVKEDQPLVDVMTEKATVEIGAPVSGKILSLRGEPGETVAIGNELVAFATADAEKVLAPAAATAARSVERVSRSVEKADSGLRSLRALERKPTAAPPSGQGRRRSGSILRRSRATDRTGACSTKTSTRCWSVA